MPDSVRRHLLSIGLMSLGVLVAPKFVRFADGSDLELPKEYIPNPQRKLLPHAMSMDIGWPIHPVFGYQLWSEVMIQRLYDNGVRWVRLIAFPEYKKGWTDAALWKMFLAVISFHNRGIRPVVLLTQGSLSNEVMTSDNFEKEFIEKTAIPLMGVLAPYVWWWQLINEPNLNPGSSNSTWMSPANYARMAEYWRVQFGKSAQLATGSINIHPGNWGTLSLADGPGWLAAVMKEGSKLGWTEETQPFSRITVQAYVDWFQKTSTRRLYKYLRPIRAVLPKEIPMSITEIGWLRTTSSGEATQQAAIDQADNIAATIQMGVDYGQVLNLDSMSIYCENDHYHDGGLSTWGMYFYPGCVPDYMPESVRASLMTPAMAAFQANAETFTFFR